jgi:GNAT superfamily N-acetyltransferase
MLREVTTYYLEMLSRSELIPSRSVRADVDFVRIAKPSPEINRFFYETCGRNWCWVDRLPWSLERWMQWLDRPGVETWILHVGGERAGYCELESQTGGSVEISYFGLLPEFIGFGFGGYALTRTIECAWAMEGAMRVWVTTASHDHPHALRNYQARGFRLYDTTSRMKDFPE